MGYVEVKDVIVKKNSIKVTYSVSKDLEHLFLLENDFEATYYADISKVPKEVAVIPFVTLVMPVVWATNSELRIPVLDKTFYKCIPNVKKGLKDMHRGVSFKGRIKVDKLINHSKRKANRTSIFFSGGVDSMSSLLSRLNENPILITIWGSDVWLPDTEGWETAKRTVEKVKDRLELENIYIKSNFRNVIDELALNDEFEEKLQDNWWHSVEHGLALLGHVAPYAYSAGIKTHYIPATYTENDSNVKCASYPTIDNNVKFCNCNVVHEGFDKTRQDKIHNICEFFKDSDNKIDIRACYYERGGKTNCCECEKCYRTAVGIVLEKENPMDYGFDLDEHDIKMIPKNLKKKKLLSRNSMVMWREMQDKFIDNKKHFKKNKSIKWMLKYKFK